MNAFDTIINSGLMTAGGAGLLVLIGLFIRRVISNTSKETKLNSAEVDILNIWRAERDAFKKLTEELQKERLELTIKFAVVENQLKHVSEQLAILVEDKKKLQDEIAKQEQMCDICPYKKHVIHMQESRKN